MRKWLLAAAGLALVVAVALVAGATAAEGKPSLAALRVQKSLTVSLNKVTGTVTASGYIKLNGKKVLTKSPSYVVTRSDSSGYACGSPQKGSGPKLQKLSTPGLFKVTVTLSSKSKYNGKYQIISKTVSADLGGDLMQCASQSPSTVSSSSICAWSPAPANPDSSQTYCGSPVAGAPGWLTSITMSGSVVHVGSITYPTAFCQKKLTPVKGMWLGSPVQDMEWDCSDRTAAIPTVSIWLTHPGSDTKCSDQATIGGQLDSFQIPSSWGGTLYVTYGLTLGRERSYLGIEYENAIFHLNGSEDGCSQLAPGPRG